MAVSPIPKIMVTVMAVMTMMAVTMAVSMAVTMSVTMSVTMTAMSAPYKLQQGVVRLMPNGCA